MIIFFLGLIVVLLFSCVVQLKKIADNQRSNIIDVNEITATVLQHLEGWMEEWRMENGSE